jgi:hypothetical protein
MEKWVKALRSKKYKQGKRVLKQKTKAGVTRHCCLGVLCELYQQEQRRQKLDALPVSRRRAIIGDEIARGSTVYKFDDSGATLPRPVRKWAGMRTDEGFFREPVRAAESLTDMNDTGCTFTRIANAIEAKYKEL